MKWIYSGERYRGARWYVKRNYLLNSAVKPRCAGYIFSQNDSLVARMRYGAGLKLGSNGCGAVAVFNVMRALGRNPVLNDVIFELEANGLLRLGGFLGTSPKRLHRYFAAHSVKCVAVDNFEEYKRRMNRYRASVIFIRERGSLVQHYYCVLKRGENDFITLNLNNPRGFGRLEWKDHFLCAYCIE